MTGGRQYFPLAGVSGPALGALGSQWQKHSGSFLLTAAVAGPFLLEPLAVLAYQHQFPTVRYGNDPLVWIMEVLTGLALAGLLRRLAARSRPSRPLAGRG